MKSNLDEAFERARQAEEQPENINHHAHPTYTVVVEHLHEEVECDNCSWQGDVDQAHPITIAHLTPGDPSPAGRCPECSMLVYPPGKSSISIPDRNHRATILAALRGWQHLLSTGEWPPVQELHDLATTDGYQASPEDIEELCGYLQT